MAAAMKADTMPIISKVYCALSQVVLVVRKRPQVVTGGGFVVTDYCTQRLVFRVEGCEVHGRHGELVVRDCDGNALLLIRRKGGIVQALSIYWKWKGYAFNYEESQKLVFSLKEPNSCLVKNNPIRISVEPRISSKNWDFEVKGHFPDKACSIVDYLGNVVAQIGGKKEAEDQLTASKDFYHVVVGQGIDQAFVTGVIAVLDYIYGESTRC